MRLLITATLLLTACSTAWSSEGLLERYKLSGSAKMVKIERCERLLSELTPIEKNIQRSFPKYSEMVGQVKLTSYTNLNYTC